MHPFLRLALSATLLVGCNDQDEAAEDKLERAAETSATLAGPPPAALAWARRNSSTRIWSVPMDQAWAKSPSDCATPMARQSACSSSSMASDRYVHVPIAGLTAVVRGDDSDRATPMTKADLAALPEVKLPAP